MKNNIDNNELVITTEDQQRIENMFRDRCIAGNIKFKSKKFYELQVEYLCGAMVALNIQLPIWVIYIQTNREIIEPYKLSIVKNE